MIQATKPDPTGQEMPTSTDAEMGVLGSILLKPDVIDEVLLLIEPGDFSDDRCRRVYEVMLWMHEKRKRIDITLLTERLKSLKIFDGEHGIGGTDFIIELAQASPTAFHAARYAEIVRDKASMRFLIDASRKTLDDAFSDRGDPDGVLQRAESRIFQLSERRYAADVVEIHDVLLAAMVEIDSRKAGKKRGLQSGYPALDSLIFGLSEGQLIIVAGRAHMGKTAMATCLIEHVAMAGGKVLFVSLEMSRLEIAERMMAQISGVPLERMQNGTINSDDRAKLTEASSELSNCKLTIDDTPTRTVSEISAVCRRQKRRSGLDLVVIDYLTIIEPDNHREPRQEQVAKLSRRLKALARELKVPVIVLAQMNREAEKGDPTPKLSHLRESGAIEQDADVVLMVHRPEYYALTDADKAPLKGKATLYVRKARNAKLGEVPLNFRSSIGRFESIEQPYDFT
jgi:replicative DNA helicase